MNCFERSHLSEDGLVASALRHTADTCVGTAHLLADLAEIEEQKIHLKRGYPSMLAFCVRVLGHSEQEAYLRIGVARVARCFPVLFSMIADGRHSLSSVRLLSRHLTPETAEDLLEAAAHKSKSEIQHLLAQRFPNPWHVTDSSGSLGPDRVEGCWSETPIAPGVYDAHVVYGQDVHDMLHYLRDLLSHQIPSGSMPEVLATGLQLAIRVAQKRKFAASDRKRTVVAVETNPDSRHIPAEVAQAVWQRDGGRCTYLSPDGRRCDSTGQLEYDHHEEFARGGPATIGNVRLMCRAHNHYLAECTYGPGFMRQKQQQAIEARVEKEKAEQLEKEEHAAEEQKKKEQSHGQAEAEALLNAKIDEAVPYLRKMSFNAAEARDWSLKALEALPEGRLEHRVKWAIQKAYAARWGKAGVA